MTSGKSGGSAPERRRDGRDARAVREGLRQGSEGGTLAANQIRFVETLIDWLTKNGVMDPGQLYEPPFSDIHQQGLDGVFPSERDADNIVSIVRAFNETVGARYDGVVTG